MADLSVTAADILPTASTVKEVATAGAVITAGQAVYKDATDAQKVKLCDADAAATANCDGIALCGAAANQPIVIAKSGRLTGFDNGTDGEPYFVSTTPGGLAPHGDLSAGDFVTYVGTVDGNGEMVIKIDNTGADI